MTGLYEPIQARDESPWRWNGKVWLILGCATFGVGLSSFARARLRKRGQLAALSTPNLISRSQHHQEAMDWVGGGVAEFEYNGTLPYAIASNVCIRRRFDDCAMFTGHNQDSKVSLNYTFERYLKITRMTSADEQAKVAGSTMLFTVSHCAKYARWDNIAHFSRELIPFANLVYRYGHELAEHALVWEAPEAVFAGTNNGFKTDWFIQSLASLMLHGTNANKTVATNIYNCEEVPLASARGGDALCFERLVAFPEPQTCLNLPFNPSVCDFFKSRVYQRFGLSPAPEASKHVLALIRTDDQGWSNYDDAARDIAGYVKQVGGTANIVFLNQSSMSLQEQVRWFMDAGVIVTTHGAHEMNLMFARAGSFHIEYFKQNHISFAFSSAAWSCGINYIAVHAKDTFFPRPAGEHYTRKYMNLPMPLDFHLELLPALQVAIGAATHDLKENATDIHPFLIRTVSKGWASADSLQEARSQYWPN